MRMVMIVEAESILKQKIPPLLDVAGLASLGEDMRNGWANPATATAVLRDAEAAIREVRAEFRPHVSAALFWAEAAVWAAWSGDMGTMALASRMVSEAVEACWASSEAH